jgi:hypothetical protein
MKYIISFLAICSVFVSISANAQDLFVKKKEPTSEYAIPDDSQSAPSSNSKSKSGSSFINPKANQKVSNDMATKYYQNCSQQSHPKMSAEALKKLCSCTATEMTKKMSVEEIRGMAENSPNGQFLRNKMLINIYAPCMKFPTYELLMGNCVNDPKIQATMTNYKKVCHCMADTMGRHVAKNGSRIVGEALQKDPNNLDPMGGYLESRDYEVTSAGYLKRCIQVYELGGR